VGQQQQQAHSLEFEAQSAGAGPADSTVPTCMYKSIQFQLPDLRSVETIRMGDELLDQVL
jgi:hypothetical protein